MRVQAISGMLALVAGLSLSTLAGCGEGTDAALDALRGTGGTDGGSSGTGGTTGTDTGTGVDTGTPAAGAFRWIAIVDSDGAPMCTTTGPGADIDSVLLSRAGATVGVGLTGSTSYKDVFPGTTAAPCTMCGSAATCVNSGDAAVDRVAGVRDGKSYVSMPDTGYAALNGGAIWLQIGSATGAGTAQDIRSGDKLTVNEVDKTYVKDGSAPDSCACLPEKYSVWAYVTMGDASTRVQLLPSAYRADNTTCTLTAGEKLGCGTTDFSVP